MSVDRISGFFRGPFASDTKPSSDRLSKVFELREVPKVSIADEAAVPPRIAMLRRNLSRSFDHAASYDGDAGYGQRPDSLSARRSPARFRRGETVLTKPEIIMHSFAAEGDELQLAISIARKHRLQGALKFWRLDWLCQETVSSVHGSERLGYLRCNASVAT